MSFRVEVSDRAARELREAAEWIAKDNPQAAERWFQGFVEALESLGKNPRICGYAQEHRKFPFELRQLLYGRRKTYRAVFTIEADSVVILTIRHTARRNLRRGELP
jgi:plasmid stabilization system protein ParE